MDILNKVLEFFQSNTVVVIVGFLYVVIEYWLGRTDFVKPGSVLEVVLVGLKKVLDFFKAKKPE